MELTDEEVADSQGTWETHPFTQRTRKFFEQKQEEALTALMNACHESTDPKVAAAFGAYRARLEHVAYYRIRAQRAEALNRSKA